MPDQPAWIVSFNMKISGAGRMLPVVRPAALLVIFATGCIAAGCTAELGQGRHENAESDRDGGEDGSPFIDAGQDPSVNPFKPLARRLTQAEYRFVVADTLGVVLSDQDLAQLPADRPLEGFANIASSQTVTPEHVAAYASLSESVAQAFPMEDFLTERGVCTEQNETCLVDAIHAFGRVLFRRPLTDLEEKDFAGLFSDFLDEEGFVGAALVTLRAMLQSPQFIYRLEDETSESTGISEGDIKTVDGYEMANRLSFLAWASSPDADLYAAAEAGKLGNASGIVEELDRLLKSREKSSRVTDRFMTDWGRLQALPDDGGLRDELIESVVQSYSAMIWEEETPIADVLSHGRLRLTPALAEGLGLQSKGDGLLPYDVSNQEGLAGLLTHPGLIAGMTNADGGAIVARGLFLQTQLFCKETPSPPTALQAEIDEFVEELPEETAERRIAEIRLERPECGACHGGFDPLAYGLAQFDYQGRFQTVDEWNNPLATDGWIPARVRFEGPDARYADVKELSQLLANEPATRHCMTKQHIKQALGRDLAETFDPLVEEIQGQTQENGGTYPALLNAIAQHDLFRKFEVQSP